MLTKLFTNLLIILLVSSLFAQDYLNKGSYQCYLNKMSKPDMIQPDLDSPNSPKHKYDVLDYKLNLDIWNCFISPYPKNYTASVIIKFRVDTALSSIDLNAVNTSLQITAVSMSGVSFTHTNNILTVTLDRTYNPNEVVFVKIDYNHLNVSDAAFYTGGGGVMTDCEPEGARKWFPCWDRPSDKATVDITAKVPGNVKLGSNGRLNDSTVTGDTIYYHWISRDPVATYLVVLSARVNWKLDIVYWGSTPIRFYYINSEGIAPQSYISDMTSYYSGKFGVHAFEKNGFTTAAASGFPWGGMENQTLTTLCSSCWGVSTVSHEYAHQWYGDAVTCGTWADIWLNEGFATYIEAIWLEHISGYSAYKSDILGDASGYFSGNTGYPIYRPEWAINTPPNGQLFNYAMTYCKGAAVLHMLRYVLQDTSVFFNCLRGYALDTANFRYKSAVTDDFAAKISQVSGQDLTWFIDEWVKQANHPVYANIYQFTGGGTSWNVGFQATQIQTNTPFHRMPLTLKVTFTSGPDTTMLVNNTSNNQVWWWTFNRQPSTFSFDPNNDIVLKQGTTNPGVVTAITANNNEIPKRFALKQNYPNPFNPVTKINFDLPSRSGIELNVYDATGKLVRTIFKGTMEAGKYTTDFNAANIASGIYYYELIAVNEKSNAMFKDVKKMVIVK
ncbi:MAG TPA: M1 family aminopeptidase [Ignavibacteria bacterium]|jgi:aminopeptidase N